MLKLTILTFLYASGLWLRAKGWDSRWASSQSSLKLGRAISHYNITPCKMPVKSQCTYLPSIQAELKVKLWHCIRIIMPPKRSIVAYPTIKHRESPIHFNQGICRKPSYGAPPPP